MSFLGVKEILKLQKDQKVVLPFLEKRVKNGAYELSLGAEVYLTDSISGKVEKLDQTNNRQVDINPGQFALLLTEEKVNIPKDKIAFISIKAGEKLKGLINVSGFHVDPGFNDHLLFSVYNAGPSTIVLNCGEPYFPIWFAELKTELEDDEAYNQDNEHYGKLNHITPKYIEFLKRGELTSPKSLLDKIKETDRALSDRIIKAEEKTERNDWLLKLLIGIVIAICLKLIWDWSAYDRGYNEGKNYKNLQEQVKQEIKKSSIDSIVSQKIDSILNKKTDHDNTKKTN
ncbi:MAG: deoxycytidine triphosphate deaminase [Mucilaginibacter sp.]|nr:deoxycytidine triphosphate deaminase [Mucilaginibacter sp.]